jgi:hypothetical protein
MMTDAKEAAGMISGLVREAEPRLALIGEDEAGTKLSPGKWSKKEILGHLIDSASNNHQRFVRAAYNTADNFPGYKQNTWVLVQRYNELPWSTLVAFWTAYNIHLSHVVAGMADLVELCTCSRDGEQTVPLIEVIDGYLNHMRHHLDVILEK